MLSRLFTHTKVHLFRLTPMRNFSLKSSFGRFASKRPDEKQTTEEKKFMELQAFEQIMSFFAERDDYTWDDLLVQVKVLEHIIIF